MYLRQDKVRRDYSCNRLLRGCNRTYPATNQSDAEQGRRSSRRRQYQPAHAREDYHDCNPDRVAAGQNESVH